MRQIEILLIFVVLSCNARHANADTVPAQMVNGEALFKTNCANCNRVEFDDAGPNLRNVCSQRSREWVYLFLTKRDTLKVDSTREANAKKYPSSCLQFPGMNQQQVDAIYNYCIPGVH